MKNHHKLIILKKEIILVLKLEKKRKKKVYQLFVMAIPGLSNQNSGQQRLGITEPISLAGPTECDVIKTRGLEKVLFVLTVNSMF